MTTRLFATITALYLLMFVAVSLALVPEIVGASASTIRSGQALGIIVLVIGGPAVLAIAFATWLAGLGAKMFLSHRKA